MCGYLFLGVHS